MRGFLQSVAVVKRVPLSQAVAEFVAGRERKDEERHGEYRTRRVILEIHDALDESIRTGKPCQTRFDPPPADPSCCHPTR